MQATMSTREQRITVQAFWIGVLLYMLTTATLVVCKIIFWNSMSGWWILLPPVLVTGVGFLDIMIENFVSRSKNFLQSRNLNMPSNTPYQSA